MLAWFIDWTTQLNQNNRVGYAVVTVLTMATIGVSIAVVVELLLKRLSAGKSAAAGRHHPPGH